MRSSGVSRLDGLEKKHGEDDYGPTVPVPGVMVVEDLPVVSVTAITVPTTTMPPPMIQYFLGILAKRPGDFELVLVDVGCSVEEEEDEPSPGAAPATLL